MFSCDVQVILNRLVVRIDVPRSSTVTEVRVLRADGSRQFAYPVSLDDDEALVPLTSAGRSFRKQNSVFSFVSEEVDLSILATTVREPLVTEFVIDDEAHAFVGCATLLHDINLLGPHLVRRFESFDHVGPLAQALAGKRVAGVAGIPMHVDYAYSENGCLLMNGWMADFGNTDVYVLANGCAFVSRGRDTVVHNRPDVTEHVRSHGSIDASHDAHGYSIAIDCVDPLQPVIIGILKDGMFSIISQEVPPLSPDKSRVFQLLLGARQGTSYTPLEKITRMLTPFLRANRRSLDYEVVFESRFAEGPPARLSIIVPFYKEWRFLFSLLSMIKSAPADFEWVIVCDDANIFPQLNQQIANQTESVRDRITFVLPRQNVGYGHANNIGVKAAKGEYVLLMNSDIWLKGFGALEFGLQALKETEYALVGFTLLFEDETVQHDGIAFKRSVEVGDRYLALHPGKGLPALPGAARYEVREAEAVTGALMLLERDRFYRIGGFHDRYIGGDFEDADLCLTLRQAGEKIGLVRSQEIFHLERQSIRHDAAHSVGFARTLVNCERFNRRWKGTLDQSARKPAAGNVRHMPEVN